MENHDPSDVSFVLERKNTGLDSSMNGPNGHGGKVGLFSIALVMCVCCINSFFTPITMTGTGVVGSSTDASTKQGSSVVASGVSGQNLLTVENEQASDGATIQLTQT